MFAGRFSSVDLPHTEAATSERVTSHIRSRAVDNTTKHPPSRPRQRIRLDASGSRRPSPASKIYRTIRGVVQNTESTAAADPREVLMCMTNTD
ncbi:hypothetical protein CH63R_01996 [Colletotrichum higginsianum IMI 349063]|uniref:Uncharacterized protein n=1 Tax=Colletotrichum higginsianum (strain IMI 349063) TaxID=759273 RepID=A0A1B7YMI4_COLHI|nr:hypothetical protein CH63R_01996 [Colletotrichum higginsianum IMI 349063]OBR13270.1 hypothetical protein CH63R_01996 [Colletotrichum higginsianum IMI 349063]